MASLVVTSPCPSYHSSSVLTRLAPEFCCPYACTYIETLASFTPTQWAIVSRADGKPSTSDNAATEHLTATATGMTTGLIHAMPHHIAINDSLHSISLGLPRPTQPALTVGSTGIWSVNTVGIRRSRSAKEDRLRKSRCSRGGRNGTFTRLIACRRLVGSTTFELLVCEEVC